MTHDPYVIHPETPPVYGYAYPYPRPMVTATVAVFDPSGRILLCRRKESSDAYPGYWCLPGGFIEVDKETAEECAKRECLEETNLALVIARLSLLGVYSDPLCDPRGHVVNAAYWSVYPDSHSSIHAELTPGDDVVDARWFTQEDVLTLGPLAFNHGDILADANLERHRVTHE